MKTDTLRKKRGNVSADTMVGDQSRYGVGEKRERDGRSVSRANGEEDGRGAKGTHYAQGRSFHELLTQKKKCSLKKRVQGKGGLTRISYDILGLGGTAPSGRALEGEKKKCITECPRRKMDETVPIESRGAD